MEHEPARPIGQRPPQTWHLCWQAAVGREFFPVPSLRQRIRRRVVDASRDRGRVLIDYCLLPTELHVVAQLGDGEEPGDLARGIGNVVARWVREVQPVRSPVLAGPFHAHRLASELELLHEVRMLAWRPVVLALCRSPIYYRGGALRVALGKRPGDGFDARPLLQMFGTTLFGARDALHAWISQRPQESECRTWELSRGLTFALSSVGPQPLVAREVRNAGAAALIAAGTDGVDGALRLLAQWVTARLGGRGVADLVDGSDAAATRGRALVARLATAHHLCSAASVARYFRRAKATLSEQVMASRSREADDEIVRTPVPRILSDVEALNLEGRFAPRL